MDHLLGLLSSCWDQILQLAHFLSSNSDELIRRYGYLALIVGTFLEGETIVLLAGIAAHSGHLELPWIIAASFTGTFIGDQLYFFIGRWKGKQFLYRYERFRPKVDIVRKHLYKHQNWLILGFRFVYGVRNVTPFVLGAADVSPRRYVSLNFIGALIWAVSFSCAGYFFGGVVEQVLEDIKKYEYYLLGLVSVAGVGLWLWRWHKKRRRTEE